MVDDKLIPLNVPAIRQDASLKRNKLAPQDPKALIKALAMDIGKNIVSYVDMMFPEAAKACSSSFRLSLRNSIYNEIMAAIELDSEGKIITALERRAKHRRDIKRLYKIAHNPDCKCYAGRGLRIIKDQCPLHREKK